MKKSKRLFATILLFIFSFANLSSISLASQTNVPDNFINMSIQQRMDWIDANVVPVYHKGTLTSSIGSARNIVRTYTGVASSAAKNAIGQEVYELTTWVEWTANMDLSVEEYRVTRQEFARSNFAPPDAGKPNYTIESCYVNPRNVKLYSQAEIAVFYNTGYTVINNINMHGNGDFSSGPFFISW